MYNSVIFDICLKFFIIKSWGMGKPIIMRQGEQKTKIMGDGEAYNNEAG